MNEKANKGNVNLGCVSLENPRLDCEIRKNPKTDFAFRY